MILGLSVPRLHASHALGAEINYTCTGPNQYQITLKFYRDCDGISAGASQTVTYSSATCGVSSSVSLSQVGPGVDITPVCPSQPTSCGGSGSFGIEEYTYQGTINLPPGCGADWVLGWSVCCRNYAITTLNGPGNQSMYVGAQLDNTLTPCNSSPSFNNPPAAMFCNNQLALYNPGAVDPDGDSLVFSLVNCLQSASGSVVYGGGFSGATPLATTSGITLNPQTGAMTFTPNAVQIGVLCVQVEEYRGGVKIGEIVRDVQFNIINCSNNAPTASGMNGTADFDTTVCVGANLCFNITTNDIDGNNIVMTWNNGVPGGSFTVTGNGGSNPSANFCWTPTPANAGSNFFTVTVEDDACPVTSQNIYTFQIDVFVSPNSINAGPDVTLCEGDTANLNATSSGALTYSWNPPLFLSNPGVNNPDAFPPLTTVYTVTGTFNDGCALQDNLTITVNPNPTLSLTPQNAYTCPGNTMLLQASSPTATSYLWSTSATSSGINVTPAATTCYWVEVTDANNCTARDTSCVNVNVPQTTSCNVVYAAPGASGLGTQADPANLSSAISMAGCNNTIVKCAIGTYTIDTAINNVTSNLTIEGGFDPGSSWQKTSSAGATTIFRSTVNPDGGPNDPRLVAFYISSAQNFNFHDLTIQVANANLEGESTYGLHLTNCSNYTFTRTQVIAGNAGAGLDGNSGASGIGGLGGGGGGAGDNDSQSNSGAGGTGGGGGGFGAGAGGAGAPGPPGCCSAGFAGNIGIGATSFRAGGGGGGAGSGGEEDRNGGPGGSGGNGGAGAAGGGGGGGGNGNGCSTGGCGANGVPGANGTNGLNGGNGSFGSHVGGFWVPGGQGGTGGDGGGGAGGGGGGGGGEGGQGGTGGFGGGSAYAVYLFGNGANTNFVDCNLTAGSAGPGGAGGGGGAGGPGGLGGPGNPYTGGEVGCGGNGGNGGTGGNGGDGGNGQNGETNAQFITGVPPVSNSISFGLATQPVITMQNVSCTQTNIDFNAGVAFPWDLGPGATPQTPFGAPVTTQYSSTGRKNILYGANSYTGFANIIQSNNLFPVIGTNAPIVNGDYRICEGQSVSFYATNGGINYIYSWDLDGGAVPNTYVGIQYDTLNNIVFNTPGVYDIVMNFTTDCCGQSPNDTIELYVDPQPTISVAGPTAFCAGDPNGVTLTASGGSSYLWAPAAGLSSTTAPTVTALPTATTTYTVTTFNATGTCTDVTNVTVTVNSFTMSTSSVNATCGPNGSATVNPAGGVGPYSYQWDAAAANQVTQTANNLQVGTYGVVVTDNGTGCVDSTTVQVSAGPGTLIGWISNIQGVSCNGLSDGTATANQIGGVGPFTYSWTGGGGAGATTVNLPAGSYTVTITDQATGCTYVTTAQIPEPQPLLIQQTDTVVASCPTAPDGGATVNASGGTGPFTYTWSPPLAPLTGNVITNQLPGNYQVVVSDQNGCTDSIPVTITSGPPPPVFLGNDTSLCAGQSLTLDATGPGIISYTWSVPPGGATPTVTVTQSGQYWVEIDDGNCTNRDTIVVTFDTPPVVDFGNDTTLCVGQTLLLDATVGGSATYTWQDGSTNPTYNVSTPGLYSVTVDSGACSVFEDINVSYDTPPVVDLGNDTTLCQGQPLSLDATTPGATYMWQDLSTTTATFSATQTQIHWVDVTLGACVVRDSIDVTFDPLPVVNFGNDTALCTGQNLLLDATNAGASYSWQDGSTNPTFNVTGPGTYSVTVTRGTCVVFEDIDVTYDTPPNVFLGNDTTLCQGQTLVLDANVGGTASYTWQDGSVNATYNVTTGGTYTVTVDSGACSVTDAINVTFDPLPTVSFGADTALCQGQTLTLDATTPGGSYVWQDNSTNPTFNVTTPGTYSVTVTAGACQVFEDINVTFDTPPTVDIGPDLTACAGSTLTLDATTPGASYVWNTGATTPTINVTTSNTYSVDVTVGACTVNDQVNVTIHALPALNLGPDTVLCEGQAIVLDASAPGTISYQWQDGSTNPQFVVTSPGTYGVTVEDVNCTNTDTVEITQAPLLVVDIGADTTICEDEEILLDVTDPLAQAYLWDNGLRFPNRTIREPGIYWVDIFNECGAARDSIEIETEDCECQIFLPNAFTPNLDNLNDVFLPTVNCQIDDYNLIIFDRWGKLIFESSDPSTGWDGNFNGKAAQEGVYAYVVRFRYTRGEKAGILLGREGSITLIR